MSSTTAEAPTTARRAAPRRLREVPEPRAAVHDGVRVVDLSQVREHAPADLAGTALAALGIVAVLVLGVYAHATTVGVTEDVQAITKVLHSVLSVAVSVLGGLVSVVLPLIVIVRLVMRRRIRRAVEAVACLFLGALVSQGCVWLLERTPHLYESLTITDKDTVVVALAPFATGLAAMLVLAGPASRDPWVRWSRNLLWIALGVMVVTGDLTLPGALVSLWLGTLVGHAARWALGSRPDRAHDRALVRAVRQAGLHPARIVRVLPPPSPDAATPSASSDGGAASTSASSANGATPALPDGGAASALSGAAHSAPPESAGLPGDPVSAEPDPRATIEQASDAAALAVAAHSESRVYAVYDEAGDRADVVVSDADRTVVGIVERIWQALRLGAVGGRTVVSLAQATEHTALVELLARSAAVRVPAVTGIGEAAGSMVVAQEHLDGAVPLRDLPADRVDDTLLAAVWDQVAAAHRASLTHGSICADVVLVSPGSRPPGTEATEEVVPEVGTASDIEGPEEVGETEESGEAEEVGETEEIGEAEEDPPGQDPPGAAAPSAGDDPAAQVWLIGWDQGNVAARSLAVRVDEVQTLAMIALAVGAGRAVASADAALGAERLAAIAPLLQTVALPRETRADARAKRQILADLRTELLALVPTADTTPVQLGRFSWRTVLTTTVVVVAVWVLLATMNFDDIVAAIGSADPWWIVATFLLGLIPYLGAALELVAFCPTRLPLGRTVVVQFAASIVSLVAPAGVGPAALNLTYLKKRKVATPLAVASVALAQVMLFLTTVVLLAVVALATGEFSALSAFPTTAVLVVLGVLALLGAALAVPAVRAWAWGKIGPTIGQVWPRIVWVLGRPRRLAVGLIGTTIHAFGYVLAFWAALQAFGITDIDFTTVAIIYLLGNTAGSAVPTPGGAGTTELAFTGGLVTAGVPQAVAASASVLFRAVTFWLMAPVGYIALRWARRLGDV